MAPRLDITEDSCRIDFSSLCGKNDYAMLTGGYDRKKTSALLWSIPDDDIRIFVKRAIMLRKKMDRCPDDEEFDKLELEQLELEKEYQNQIKTQTDDCVTTNQALTAEIEEKARGYNTTESAVFMHYVAEHFGVHVRNDDYNNCKQDVAICVFAKIFGWKESSYTGKVSIDFLDSATRRAMRKVALDVKEYIPKLYEMIMKDYDEYEDEFLDKQKKMKK